MKSEFVLESFQAYLEFSESKINEAKGEFTPDLNFVKKYVDRLLEKQKELAMSKDSIFSKYSKEKNPYEAWINNYKGKKGEDWPDEKEVGKGKLKVYGAFAAPYLWSNLSEEQKNEVYKEMLDLMKKSGYTKEKDFNQLLEKKPSLSQRPFVSVYPSTVEIPPTPTPIPGTTTIEGLAEGVENRVFKDNRWGSGDDSAGGKVNDEAFQDPAVLAELRKKIDDFVKKFASGEISKIISMRIESSASRYKNTDDAKGGKAEKLSWGELSYNRAMTILALFREAADANGLSEEKRKEIQEKTVIDSKGSNGDGSSGPNPPGPTIGFGYYDENSKWVPNNGTFGQGKTPEENRKLIVKSILKEGGKPTKEYTTSVEAPKSTAAEYAQFRYVNFIIEAEILEKSPDKVIEKGDEKTNYKPEVGFPKTSVGKEPPRKRRRRQVGTSGPGTNPFRCPEL